MSLSTSRGAKGGSTEARFPVVTGRLGTGKAIRLSVTDEGPPSILGLEGPVRTAGRAVANSLFWTVLSGR